MFTVTNKQFKDIAYKKQICISEGNLTQEGKDHCKVFGSSN